MSFWENIKWWYNWKGWEGVFICLFGYGEHKNKDNKNV